MRLALAGATGRMGARVRALAAEAGDIEIVAVLDSHLAAAPASGHGEGARGGAVDDVANESVAVPGSGRLRDEGLANAAYNELPTGADRPDACIDFTLAAAVPAVARLCADAGVPIVCGTTGLDDPATAALDAAAQRVPVLWASNFSLGIAVLNRLVGQAARALGPEYAVEIVETHHRRKQDSPSGTALTLARTARDALAERLGEAPTFVHGREGAARGGRRASEIGVHSLRGGEVVGEHTVHFLGPAERLELGHRAQSRDVFAAGAIRAARWLVGREPGRYTVDDWLADQLDAPPG